ncbi:hypothetical protein FGB62_123g015 [Gracilaria domingensis]|nr:hypothetical protein FGB62_123g015 [Gracilaria domingensis]
MFGLTVSYETGETTFYFSSSTGNSASVDLSVFLRTKGGVNMRTMPFRPEIMGEAERNLLLNGILNGVRHRLGYRELDARHKLWAGTTSLTISGVVYFVDLIHFHDWNDSVTPQMITAALIAELRYLDLVLNSTGKPWVFSRGLTFEQLSPSIAVVKRYSIAHGWLLIATVLVTVIQFLVNSRVTHFEEVAFVAMKELMGADCVLGPLAANSEAGTDVELLEEDVTVSQEST